jgi:hypothetical protein
MSENSYAAADHAGVIAKEAGEHPKGPNSAVSQPPLVARYRLLPSVQLMQS